MSSSVVGKAEIDLSRSGRRTGVRNTSKGVPGESGRFHPTTTTDGATVGWDGVRVVGRTSRTMWYMSEFNKVVIGAPKELVWSLFTDVRGWPEWTSSVTRVAFDVGTALNVGSIVRIKQPRMPEMKWAVIKFDPPNCWTWKATSIGVTTTAEHVLESVDDATTQVQQSIRHDGPLSRVVSALTGRRTRRFLEHEAAGLKQRCEASYDSQ